MMIPQNLSLNLCRGVCSSNIEPRFVKWNLKVSKYYDFAKAVLSVIKKDGEIFAAFSFFVKIRTFIFVFVLKYVGEILYSEV